MENGVSRFSILILFLYRYKRAYFCLVFEKIASVEAFVGDFDDEIDVCLLR